jgi:hypothetical protein
VIQARNKEQATMQMSGSDPAPTGK